MQKTQMITYSTLYERWYEVANHYNMFDPKGTAKLIRADLKKRFPKIKFSVRADRTVFVHYPDSVTGEEVEKITSKHEYGNYNAIEDIHEIVSSKRNDAVPQVDYVMLCRAY